MQVKPKKATKNRQKTWRRVLRKMPVSQMKLIKDGNLMKPAAQ